MSDAMVELATCPVCLLVRVEERLLVCQAGHLLCSPCYNLLPWPPLHPPAGAEGVLRSPPTCPLAHCTLG